MNRVINKIARSFNFIIILIINVIFLFGGQTFPSSRLVQTEIPCQVPTSINPRDR
jgi:hypothetical protein